MACCQSRLQLWPASTALLAAALSIPHAYGQEPFRCDARSNVHELSALTVHAGSLAPGDTICFSLSLPRGELVRLAISVEHGYVRGRVLSPAGEELQRTWTSSFAFAAPSPMLTLEAPASGRYIVELSVPAWVNFTASQSFRIHIVSREEAAVRAARRAQLQRDPRVIWLRAHAQRLRSLEPADTNFTDLEFLHARLRDTRVVFLGEGDNGGGSDLLMKTRLVRFLHARMGFDVLVFQANIHSARAAWLALQAGADARTAFDLAVSPLISRSQQGEPLLEYVRAAARSDHPLELAGFDSQLTGTASQSLLPGLRLFLARHAPNSALLDETSLASRVLSGIIGGRFAPGQTELPTLSEQAAAVEALGAEARTLGTIDAVDARFWSQVLKSTTAQVELLLNNMRGATARETSGALTRQLADNLLWLLNTEYRDRKVIIWAHTAHALRTHEATSTERAVGSTVGQAVSQALGSASFSIGFTSYNGTSYFIRQPEDYYQSVIPHQHPGDAFETLMSAAGHDLAFVDLRRARQQGHWLSGHFIANALYLVPQEAEWSRALDALLFIHTQQPRRRSR